MLKMRFAFVTLLMLVVALPVGAQRNPTATPEPVANAEVEVTPEATSEVDPTVITEGLSTLFEEYTDWSASEIEERLAYIQALKDTPWYVTEDGSYVLGSEDAPITLIEFVDWACPHCQAYQETIDSVIEDYVFEDMAALELRIFPTAGGQNTVLAGELAACTDEVVPGAYWEIYILFFDVAGAYNYLTQNFVLDFVDVYGLDIDATEECLGDYERMVASSALANEIGITGTPGIAVRYPGEDPAFINYNDRVFNSGGPTLEVLSAVIEAAQ